MALRFLARWLPLLRSVPLLLAMLFVLPARAADTEPAPRAAAPVADKPAEAGAEATRLLEEAQALTDGVRAELRARLP